MDGWAGRAGCFTRESELPEPLEVDGGSRRRLVLEPYSRLIKSGWKECTKIQQIQHIAVELQQREAMYQVI
jgi:hypothetical protein